MPEGERNADYTPSLISGELTLILKNWDREGEPAREHLMSQMYPELKRIAEARMRRERVDHTLQPTALVNEFFVRLAMRQDIVWNNRAHFLAVASRAMRRMLVDYARAHSTGKRGRGGARLDLEMISGRLAARSVDTLELNDLLEHLEAEEPRMARVVEMHYFGGLTYPEIGEILNLDVRTVKRDWRVARAWLLGHLRKGAPNVGGRVGAN